MSDLDWNWSSWSWLELIWSELARSFVYEYISSIWIYTSCRICLLSFRRYIPSSRSCILLEPPGGRQVRVGCRQQPILGCSRRHRPQWPALLRTPLWVSNHRLPVVGWSCWAPEPQPIRCSLLLAGGPPSGQVDEVSCFLLLGLLLAQLSSEVNRIISHQTTIQLSSFYSCGLIFTIAFFFLHVV